MISFLLFSLYSFRPLIYQNAKQLPQYMKGPPLFPHFSSWPSHTGYPHILQLEQNVTLLPLLPPLRITGRCFIPMSFVFGLKNFSGIIFNLRPKGALVKTTNLILSCSIVSIPSVPRSRSPPFSADFDQSNRSEGNGNADERSDGGQLVLTALNIPLFPPLNPRATRRRLHAVDEDDRDKRDYFAGELITETLRREKFPDFDAMEVVGADTVLFRYRIRSLHILRRADREART